MKSAAKQEFKKRILTSRFFLFFLLIAFIWVAITCIKITYKKKQIIKEIENFQMQISKIKEENQKLSNLKSFLANPNYLEKEAKKRLNLKKQGEEVVMVPDNQVDEAVGIVKDEGAEEVVSETGVGELEKESNLRKWWRYFFH